MQKISKLEMDFLIEKNVLKQSKGNFGDNLIVTVKFSSGRGKQRYITDPLYNYLLRLQSQEKVDKETIKHNQKYLFGTSVS